MNISEEILIDLIKGFMKKHNMEYLGKYDVMSDFGIEDYNRAEQISEYINAIIAFKS